MSLFNDRMIQNAFTGNLDRKALEYLRETFENLEKKGDRIRTVPEMDNFVRNNFTGSTRSQLIDKISRANPRDVGQYKSILIEELLSIIASSVSNIRGNITFDDLLKGITKEKYFFYDMSEYMPPTALRPYDSYPNTPNTFSTKTMENAINEFNRNLPRGSNRVDYDSQGLDLLHNLLRTVVHSIKKYDKRDEREVRKLIRDLKVNEADRGVPLEHELTSKLFSLIIHTLGSENKRLNERELKEILPKLPNYNDISAFLVYPLHL